MHIGLRPETLLTRFLYANRLPLRSKTLRKLLNNLRHQEEVAFGRGRVGNDIVGDLAVIDQILPLLHLHRGDRGHGLHTLDIDLRELLDKGEHGVEFALQMRNLALGNRNARQMRDAADGSGVDGHYIRPLTAKTHVPYSRGRFCAATGAGSYPASAFIRASADLARSRVSSAAGTSRPRAIACPAQRFVKSTLPCFSAAAFSGPSAVAAWGNGGASGEIGPASRIRRFWTPRAGRPVMNLVVTVKSPRPSASAARAAVLTLDSGQRR